MTDSSPLVTSRQSASYWRATFDNPPRNLIDPRTVAALRELMDALQADPTVKVVVFDSAHEAFFISHFDTARGEDPPTGPGPTGLPGWSDLAARLTCDLRFASQERAVFAQPEVGLGLVPGGGAIEVLSELAGRSRALEIAPRRPGSGPRAYAASGRPYARARSAMPHLSRASARREPIAACSRAAVTSPVSATGAPTSSRCRALCTRSLLAADANGTNTAGLPNAVSSASVPAPLRDTTTFARARTSGSQPPTSPGRR